MLKEYLSALANKFRDKLGTTEKINAQDFVDKVDEVYAAGEDNTLREVWEALQNGGKRSSYTNLCNHIHWTPKTFKPIYDIKVTSCYLFGEVNIPDDYVETLKREGQISIKELEEERGITFAFLGGNCDKLGTHPMFREYNLVDISTATALNYAFYGGYLANDRAFLLPTRIERLICSETTPFKTTTFQYAEGFEYIGFEGLIGQSLNLQWSKKLDKDSIVSLMNILSDTASGKTLTLSLTAVNNAFETSAGAKDGSTSAEWTALVDAKTNWTITLADG